MGRKATRQASMLVALVIGAFASAPGFADKPDWAGGGNGGGKHEQRDKGRGHDRDDHGGRQDRDDRRHGDSRGPSVSVDVQFHDSHRTVIRDYYRREFSGGHCPPGLAKKGNGCMPPGLAKKWSRGRPLPRDVVYYDLPPALVVEIGIPPAGYKYVRVAGDILMIAIGTSMVVDAIEDLSRM